jgi:hypothetical protein
MKIGLITICLDYDVIPVFIIHGIDNTYFQIILFGQGLEIRWRV